MSISIPLAMVVIFLLLMVGGIVTLVTLLSSEKGRTFLKVLLIVPVMLLLVGLLTVVSYRRAASPRPDRHERIASRDFDRHDHRRGGRGHREERHLHPVNGRVDYNGDPLADGTIRFVSTSSPLPGLAPSAEIIDGKYSSLRIAAGTYRVEIEAIRTDDGLDETEIDEPRQYLPGRRYNEASALTAEVIAGTNWLNFDLASDPADTPAGIDVTGAIALAEPDPAPETDEPAAGDRPKWADWQEYALHKVGGVCRMAIRVGPYSTRLECDQELANELDAAIAEYAAVYVEPEARDQVRLPIDYVQTSIVQDDWEEMKDVVISPTSQIPEKSVPMVQLNVLLEFDHAANARIREEWDRAIVADRILGIGALTAIVLALLAGVYGYLEIDLVTGGAYRRRLRLAAVGAVLLLIATGLCLYLFVWQWAGVTVV